MEPAIRAYETLDCAAKVRVHYLLPVPLDTALPALFEGAEAQLQPFSKMIPGARDHVSWTTAAYRAAGVANDERLVVTFGKKGGDRPEEEIRRFEAQLSAILGVPLRYEARQMSDVEIAASRG